MLNQMSQPHENSSLDLTNDTEKSPQQVDIYLQRTLYLKSKTTRGTLGLNRQRCAKLH